MDTVLAVIVLYNIKLAESTTFNSLTAALQHTDARLNLLVYDNSEVSTYEDTMYQHWDITYVHDPANPGVSKAYNYGLKIARELNKHWLLLLDQDTMFPINSISSYSTAITNNQVMALIAPIVKVSALILSPYKNWYGHGRSLKQVNFGATNLKDYKVVNSGLMIHVDLFEKCGGYNETIRMDYSDLSFLLKAQKHIKEVIVIDLACEQKFFHLEEENTELRLSRFNMYCHDLNAIYTQTRNVMYKITGLLRALKLSVTQKQFDYLCQFYKICLT